MQDVEEFRAEVRQWLADNLVGEFAALKGLGGPGREHEAFEERRAWNQHLAAAGLTCLGWPLEHGGRGLSTAGGLCSPVSTPDRAGQYAAPRHGCGRCDGRVRLTAAGTAYRIEDQPSCTGFSARSSPAIDNTPLMEAVLELTWNGTPMQVLAEP